MSDIDIRKAKIEDAGLILRFVKELATYEKGAHQVVATVADIEKNLFSEATTTEAVICIYDNEPIGFAVYFMNFSTWLGKNGLFLEDLYISPTHRGIGAGKKMFTHLAKIAVENDCGRFEWNVLKWNEPAIKFYKSFGAKPQNEWVGYRLEGNPLKEFANT